MPSSDLLGQKLVFTRTYIPSVFEQWSEKWHEHARSVAIERLCKHRIDAQLCVVLERAAEAPPDS